MWVLYETDVDGYDGTNHIKTLFCHENKEALELKKKYIEQNLLVHKEFVDKHNKEIRDHEENNHKIARKFLVKNILYYKSVGHLSWGDWYQKSEYDRIELNRHNMQVFSVGNMFCEDFRKPKYSYDLKDCLDLEKITGPLPKLHHHKNEVMVYQKELFYNLVIDEAELLQL